MHFFQYLRKHIKTFNNLAFGVANSYKIELNFRKFIFSEFDYPKIKKC